MKKVMIFLMTATMALALTGCGNGNMDLTEGPVQETASDYNNGNGGTDLQNQGTGTQNDENMGDLPQDDEDDFGNQNENGSKADQNGGLVDLPYDNNGDNLNDGITNDNSTGTNNGNNAVKDNEKNGTGVNGNNDNGMPGTDQNRTGGNSGLTNP
ncbi:MAG: hypothetical protein PUB22_00440 [Clostridiales bacterium]|nr:hypothetical protein [Clostridiales bacterium]